MDTQVDKQRRIARAGWQVPAQLCFVALDLFDHLDLDAFDDAKVSPYIRRTRAIVAGLGEPMSFGFDPATMAADLESVGLTLVEQLTPATIQARYFAGRSDGYRALEHTHFAAATTR